MKRFFLCSVMFVFVVGCRSFDVVVKDDPFKGSTVVTADMWHEVVEGNIDNRRVLYEKEIKNGKVLEPTATFNFFLLLIPIYGTLCEPLGKDAYILCDNKSFKVNINDNKRAQQSGIAGSGNTNASGNYNASVSSYHTCILSGKITLKPDAQKAILECKTYMLRFYMGSNIVTLKATNAQLTAVKKFLATDATNIQKK